MISMSARWRLATTLVPLFVAGCAARSGQIADPNFHPEIGSPAFAPDTGPVVLLDEAHFNFHTVEGRYRPFAELLRRDGYAVRGSNAPFTPAALADANILVITNAIAEDNVDEWTLPNPSAFSATEISAKGG